jgi:hypothetical protein
MDVEQAINSYRVVRRFAARAAARRWRSALILEAGRRTASSKNLQTLALHRGP